MWTLSVSLLFLGLQLHVSSTAVNACLEVNGVVPPFQNFEQMVNSIGYLPMDHAIVPSMVFSCHGNVTGWAAYLKRNRLVEIRFQVWRQSTTSSNCSYELVGEHRFLDGQARERRFLLNVSAVAEGYQPITVQPGDFVGFYSCCNNKASIQDDRSTMVDVHITSEQDQIEVESITSISVCPQHQEGIPIISAMVDIIQIESTTISSTMTTDTLPDTTQVDVTTASTNAPASTSGNTEQQTTQQQTTQQQTTQQQTTQQQTTQQQTTQQQTTELITEFTTVSSPTTEASTDNSTASFTPVPASTETTPSSLNEMTTAVTVDNQSALSQTIIVIIAAITAFAVGVAIVILALVLFKCVRNRVRSKRITRRQLELKIMPLSGSIPRTDSHVYTDVKPTLKTDLEATYCEVDLSNIEKKLSLSQSPENYEVPQSSLATMLRQSTQVVPSSPGSEHYDVPLDAMRRFKPLTKRQPLKDDEDYTEMASVPLREGFLTNQSIETSENIYEVI